ncbi:hypothetical protein O7626_05565 [Micromonospora sp. WMMD1102]|uniref:hypothetical protein n=1 Tax=Micromonospora sp. WMMD1102 TaxID=3016105 RepID=UPI002415221D|nr:hypothetical protein [Micromonospora sp. WMMD1102]MDG4785405.1 hypothetical protein [Micromonospora sp. WMMD1102]
MPRGQEDLAPRGEVARLNANLAALRTLRTLQAEDRPATVEEQAVLARWSGWGAVPGVFEGRADHRDHARFEAAREQLRQLLDEREYAAAERNTLNAHYTAAAYVRAIWDAVRGLGFAGGDVLEPGCGSGTFIGLAPDGARLTGVEVEPVTAGIAAALYPHATIRTESFRGHPRAGRHVRPDDQQRAVRQLRAGRPAAQPGQALDPQPLPDQEFAPDQARWAGRGADLPLHDGRREPGRPAGDGRAGGPGVGGAAAKRRARGRGRHQGRHRPADPAPP